MNNLMHTFIQVSVSLLICLFLYGISILTTSKPKLYRNGLWVALLAHGFSVIGRLKPEIVPYSPYMSPETVGKLGTAALLIMMFLSYYRMSKSNPDAQNIRRMAIRDVAIGLGVTLTLSLLATIYESSQQVAQKEELTAETNQELLKAVRAVQAFDIMMWQKLIEVQDRQEKFERQQAATKSTAPKVDSNKARSSRIRRKSVLPRRTPSEVPAKIPPFDVMPGSLPEVVEPPKPIKFKGQKH